MTSHLKDRKRVITFASIGTLVAFLFVTNPTSINRKLSESSDRPIFDVSSGSHQLPLKYPFFVCQYGNRRSATTFQTELLKAISQLKSPSDESVYTQRSLPRDESENAFGVLKTHSPQRGLECIDKGYPIFTSDRPGDPLLSPGNYDDKFIVTLHHQKLEEMEKCSLCQVDYYQPIFALSDEEVTILKQYMHLWEKVRQCCGLQMSKYNMARLHGCDMTPFQRLPSYPMCEIYNMEEIEKMFANQPIAYRPDHPSMKWAEPGDCAKFDDLVREGAAFNGNQWDGKCPVIENEPI